MIQALRPGGRRHGNEPRGRRGRPGQHRGHGHGGGVPDAAHVGLPEQVEIGVRGLPQRRSARDDRGAGDDGIEPTPAGERLVDGLCHRAPVADIGDPREAQLVARDDRLEISDRRHRVGRRVGPGAGIDGHDRIPVGEQSRDRRGADPRAAPVTKATLIGAPARPTAR